MKDVKEENAEKLHDVSGSRKKEEESLTEDEENHSSTEPLTEINTGVFVLDEEGQVTEVLSPYPSEEDGYAFAELFKRIVELALPTSVSYSFSIEVFLITILQTYSDPDDEDSVAAATLIAVLLNALVIVGLSPLFSMSFVASKTLGELATAEKDGESEEALEERRAFISGINRNGLKLALPLVPLIALPMIFAESLLVNVFHQDENVAAIAGGFLRVYSPAVLALALRLTSENMMLSFGRATQAMGIGLVNLGIGTGIAAWLGFGGLGIPKLGTKGIAIGYLIEAYLTAIAYSLYIAYGSGFEKYHFFQFLKPFVGQREQFKDLLKIGSTITCAIASEMAMSLSLGIFAGLLDPTDQAAMTYINQVIFLNFLLIAGFGQAEMIKLNKELGAKAYFKAQQMGRQGLLITLAFTTPIPLFFACAPNLLVISSEAKEELGGILTKLAPIILAGNIVDSARYNLLQQLRALDDFIPSTAISIAGLSSGIVASGLLGLKTELGIYGVGMGYLGGILFIATPGLLFRWHSRIQAENIAHRLEQPVVQDPKASAKSQGGLFNFFKKKPQTTPLLEGSVSEDYHSIQRDDENPNKNLPFL